MILAAKELTLGYESEIIVPELNLFINAGEIVTFIGPNGSGKSTILKALARYLKAKSGVVYLNGQDIHRMPTKKVAQQLAILPQTPSAPSDLTVAELASRGRAPHLAWWQRSGPEDYKVIRWALEQTKTTHLADRLVGTLSGGERQRAWIAMALAQSPQILLLDEPTTYLDICHQLEVMELIKRLNRELKLTVVMVLHDINQAARYSHRLIVLKKGRIVAQGPPSEILTAQLLTDVFKVKAVIKSDAETGTPICLPYGIAE
ncbi:MAG: ABC transporter ATP-binding protein [Firmicutes bacterium]|nr:ABC transporter ATP-binding protein [Bacillota bacterium]